MKSSTGVTAAATIGALGAFAGNSLLCRKALGSQAADPASFTAVRIVSGALVLLAIAAWRTRSSPRADSPNPTDPSSPAPARSVASNIIAGGWLPAFWLFAYAAAFSWAYGNLTTGTGALLLFGSVQVTMIAWGLLRGERPRWTEWLALPIAMSGLWYLVAPGLAAPPLGGSVLMIGAGMAWGGYSLAGRRGADPIATTTGNFLRAAPMAVLLAPVAWLAHSPPALNQRGFLLALVSGAVTSGLGYVVWYVALRGLTATRAATLQLLVPILAALGGVIFLGETVTARLVIAAALVLGGVGLGVRKT